MATELAKGGGAGGGGFSTESQSTRQLFTYTDGPLLDFGDLADGDEVVEVQILIEVPFDDPASLLSFGLVSSPGNILPTNMIDPTTEGTYHCAAVIPVTGSDQFRLQILPGTSTQGSGRVVARTRQE